MSSDYCSVQFQRGTVYRTRVVGNFPDGESALMLVSARLRHIAGTKWGQRKYLNMELLKELEKEQKAG